MMIETEAVGSCPLCDSKSFTEITRTKDYGFATCDNDFTYVRCSDCTAMYLHNRPLLSKLDLIYPAEYTAFHPSKKTSLVQRARDIVQFKKYKSFKDYITPNDAILEFGCGSGELLKVIKTKGSPTHRLVGIDFSDYAAKDLRDSGIEFSKGDIIDYESKAGAFGAVILNQVIEHMAAPRKILKKIKHLLRDGGIVYFETPAIGAWDSRIAPLHYWGGWHAPRHFVIFSEQTLGRILKEENFELVSVSYFFSPFLWANTLQFYLEQELGYRKLAKFFRISFFPYLCFIGVVEFIQKLFTGKTSNLRVIARKVGK